MCEQSSHKKNPLPQEDFVLRLISSQGNISMSQRSIRWLYEELPGLIAAGVVTNETAQRLRAHYGEVREVSRTNIALIAFSILGAALIGSGVILVVAHNWDSFSRPTRTMLAIAPLVIGQAIGAWVLLQRPRSAPWGEGITLFLGGSIGASIAIVGQIYHLPENPGAFFLTWILLFLPLVYLFNSTAGVVFYLVGALFWAANVRFGAPGQALGFWPLTLLVLPQLIRTWRAGMGSMHANILARALALYFIIGVGIVLDRGQPGLWIIVYTSLFSAFILLAPHWPSDGIRNPFLWFGAVGALVVMLILTFDYPWFEVGRERSRGGRWFSEWMILHDSAITVAMPLLVLLLARQTYKRDLVYTAFWVAFPTLAIVCFVISAFGAPAALPLFLFNLFMLGTGIGFLYDGFKRQELTIANYGMVVLTFLAIARFFDSDLPILLRGVLFIVVGAMFLITNVILVRRRVEG